MRNYMVTITRMLVAGTAILLTAHGVSSVNPRSLSGVVQTGGTVAGTAILLTAHGVSSVNPRSLSGVVQTGGTSSNQPLPNVHVTLFEATSGLPHGAGRGDHGWFGPI